MTQYIRYCSLIISNGSKSLDLSTLRCRFTLSQWNQQAPNKLTAQITNILPTTARSFTPKSMEYTKIKLDVGYQDNHGVMFQGDIKQGTYQRESPTDTLLTLYCADNLQAHNYAVVSTTLPPGSTPQQHVDVAMEAMGKFGTTKGYIGADLSKPVYPRAVTLYGMARDVLARVAVNANANVSYQNEALTMVPKGGSAPGSAIILNSSTGLVGMPSQGTDGIHARCLFNPQIKVNGQVKIDQKDVIGSQAAMDKGGDVSLGQTALQEVAADGLYTVLKIEGCGDTRGNPWYMDLSLLATNRTETPQTPLSLYMNFGG